MGGKRTEVVKFGNCELRTFLTLLGGQPELVGEFCGVLSPRSVLNFSKKPFTPSLTSVCISDQVLIES